VSSLALVRPNSQVGSGRSWTIGDRGDAICDVNGLHHHRLTSLPHDRYGPRDVDSMHMAGIVHRHPLGDAIDMSAILTKHSASPGCCRSRGVPVRKSFPHPELLGWPSVPYL
jgi:hypothetical protein